MGKGENDELLWECRERMDKEAVGSKRQVFRNRFATFLMEGCCALFTTSYANPYRETTCEPRRLAVEDVSGKR